MYFINCLYNLNSPYDFSIGGISQQVCIITILSLHVAQLEDFQV